MRKAAVIVIILAAALLLSLKNMKAPLETAVNGADRIELAPTWPLNEPAFFEIQGKATVEELIEAIDIAEWRSFSRCMCFGDAAIRFYKGDELLATLGYAHGESLKWPDGPWRGDAALTWNSQAKLRLWFRNQGYDGFDDGGK